MEKLDFGKQFSLRLKDALIKAGYHSTRSSFGVDIQKLVKLTGYSEQICRKYLRGEAMPEITKIQEIATELKVSPGWLLFGENNHSQSDENLVINKELLLYIFCKANKLYNRANAELPEFLLELVTDLSAIKADLEQLKKIVDLALLSVQKFSLV